MQDLSVQAKNSSIVIRTITEADFRQFWPCFQTIIQAQSTYAFDPAMTYDQAYQLWCELPHKTFVAVHDNQILGSYYLKPNAQGPGAHVCNCGYIVTEAARGRGLARMMCEHSQQVAVELGYKAMQFNAVVATNVVAVALWKKLGFRILGTVPNAYKLKGQDYVDSYIMYKELAPHE
jgi:RimJ/RimL family protein N-acetyltransferase